MQLNDGARFHVALPNDSAARKTYPIATALFGQFPAAIARLEWGYDIWLTPKKGGSDLPEIVRKITDHARDWENKSRACLVCAEQLCGIALTLLESSLSVQDAPRPPHFGLWGRFGSALAAVSHHAYKGNMKHNGPDSPLQDARDKSTDDLDCIMRHWLEGDYEALAWRSLRVLQLFLERCGAPVAPAATGVDKGEATGQNTKDKAVPEGAVNDFLRRMESVPWKTWTARLTLNDLRLPY